MKPFAWSFSSLTRYENCPKSYGQINVLKNFADEDSEVSRDGKTIHVAMFNRVIKGVALPLPLRYLEAIAKPFADVKGEKHGEMKIALTKDLEPTAYFSPSVWMRVVLDFTLIDGKRAVIADWKTGKVKNDFTQMGLCAAALSRMMPEIDLFETALVWTGANDVSPKEYSKADLVDVWANVLPRVKKMEEAYYSSTFPARESGLCGWCPVNNCLHWRERT